LKSGGGNVCSDGILGNTLLSIYPFVIVKLFKRRRSFVTNLFSSSPCSHYVCHKHQNEFTEKRMECILCNQTHNIPEDGWQVDLMVQDLIQSFKVLIDNIKKDETYNELKNLINDYQGVLDRYKFAEENRKQFIEDHHSNLSQMVDLRREKLNQEIAKISNKLIDRINNEKEKCIEQMSRTEKRKDVDFESEREEIIKWKKEVEEFEYN
jgi:hypothetical protein